LPIAIFFFRNSYINNLAHYINIYDILSSFQIPLERIDIVNLFLQTTTFNRMEYIVSFMRSGDCKFQLYVRYA